MLDVRVVGLYDQRARGVVAARGAHRVDERLVVRLLHPVVFGRRRTEVRVHLVRAREQHALVIGAEGGGDLRPQRVLPGVDRRRLRVRDVILQPAVVPVDVYDDVHVLTDGHVDHLLHTRHPVGRDIGRAVGDVAVPGNWNANGIETRRLDGVDQRLVGGRVAPGRLAADRLERVAEVPAEIYLAGDLLRGRKSLGRSGN